MGANIEIKAHSRDFAGQAEIAADLAGQAPETLLQTDTFFHVAEGRLKLREFGDGSAELIQYQRVDDHGPKASNYVISPASDPRSLKAALDNALGTRAVVSKTRRVFLVGQTRIHFDEVEGLGRFIELEVVLAAGQAPDEGRALAEELMRRLDIREQDLVVGAYVDLIESGHYTGAA